MARYKGKRENHGLESKTDIGDPFQDDPFNVGDPFAENTPKKKSSSKTGRAAYWKSGKGKILAVALGCLLAFVVVVAVAAKMWIKPPPLPAEPIQNATPQQTVTVPGQTEAPVDTNPTELSDDEMYPDDGYNGDMPTVSGNRKEGMYTFLLVGTDMGDGNTDTIMVASYDTKGQKVNIMSIPRDTMINESWDIKKINSVYSRTGGSMNSLANRIQKLVGFKPDFYVKVDLSMFVKLVDLVEGVEFDVPQDMKYDDPAQDLHINLKKGVQVLDGQHAMQLVRFRRYSEGDIKRVEVQQAFMKALIKECLSVQHWGKMKSYIDLAMENVQTDLDAGSVVWFAANVLGLNGTPALDMENVYTCTIPGNYWGETWSRATNQNQSYVTIYPKQVVDLVNERFNPYEQRVTTGMLDAMSIQSNGNIASSTGSVKDTQHNAIMAVRRGEAYYDNSGNVTYGKPPAKPKQDENGNYYILDDNGKTVFTDANGKPLPNTEPELPTENGDGQPITLPLNPTDGNSNQTGASEPGNQTTPENPTFPDGQTEPDTPALPDNQTEPDLPDNQTEPDTPALPDNSANPNEQTSGNTEPPVESTEPVNPSAGQEELPPSSNNEQTDISVIPDWLRPAP